MTRVTVLTGGVGGAKLVLGLTELLGGENVTAIVNTGDDFSHFGLRISPDIDTLLYTLSGKSNETLGWGREGESWAFMAAIRSLGGPDWFNLGDGDLALHVMRTQALVAGDTLSAVTMRFGAAWGVASTMLPMTDDHVATIVDTDMGELSFQRYFVEKQCAPAVRAVRFEGVSSAAAGPGVLAAIGAAEAIVIAPSNPYLSVDPILAVPGIRAALQATPAPVVAVSPVMNGQSFKGPTAKMMRELGLGVSSATIADHYVDVLDGLMVDDADPLERTDMAVARADIAMPTLARKIALADAVMAFAANLAARRKR